MYVFVTITATDRVSFLQVNTWGDQPTLEIVRQVVESDGMYFLEKDKRGDRKICENMLYVAAMSHPGEWQTFRWLSFDLFFVMRVTSHAHAQ